MSEFQTFGSQSGPIKYVGPDLGLSCLQRLSADDKGRQTRHSIFLNLSPLKFRNSHGYEQEFQVGHW